MSSLSSAVRLCILTLQHTQTYTPTPITIQKKVFQTHVHYPWFCSAAWAWWAVVMSPPERRGQRRPGNSLDMPPIHSLSKHSYSLTGTESQDPPSPEKMTSPQAKIMASTSPKMKAKSHGHSTTLHPWTRNKHRLRAWINAAHRVSGSSTAVESGRISRRHLRINTRTTKSGTTKNQDCCDTIINSQN